MQRVLTSLVFVVLLGAPAAGVEPADRPRVCVVLSGGGALGSAHVGVLKVLDELKVPVDCVAGTSMGAVVGGMYAAGYTPAELEDILLAIDWSDLLDDRPRRQAVPYRRKQDDLTFLTRLEVGFNRGRLQLPTALITGQKLDFLLQALAAHTVGVDSFDALVIPFRAVATDLESGEEVVLDHGDLARAVRASMAVPGVFRPVEIDGRVLVDGGLVNNLPVDQAHAMGAEVVIAVDVGEPLRTRDRLRSLTGITGQVVSMMTRGNVDRQLAGADLVIHPAVEEFDGADFTKARKMIPMGEEAARQVADELARYSVDDDDYASYRSRFQRRDIEQPTVVSVEVELASSAEPELVLSRIRTRAGDPLDMRAVARDLERLYSLGDFELVGFTLSLEDDGYGLHIEAHQKSWGPHTMRFGLNLFADFEGTGEFNILGDYTMTRLNRLRAEAKLALQVGEEPRLFAEFYQPLNIVGRWFVAPHLEAWTDRTGDITSDVVAGGVDLGLSLGRFGEIRLGAVRGYARTRPAEGGAESPLVTVDWGGLTGRVVLDQIDNPNFPRSGYIGNLSVLSAREGFDSDAEYDRVEWGVLGATSTGPHTVLGWFKGGDSLGSDLPPWWWFQLGGLFNLSGYAPGALSGPNAAVGVLSYYYRLVEVDSTLVEAVYGGMSVESGKAWDGLGNGGSEDLLWSGSLFLGADTFFGPLYLAYGRARDGPQSVYLFLGRSF